MTTTGQRGERVLITGASRGIGRELAEVFAENGFDLILVARSRDALETLGGRLESAHGIDVTVVPRDLLNEGATAELHDSLVDRGLEVDVLVNNAGALELGAFHEIPLEDHLRLIRLNVSGLTELTHLWLRRLVPRGSGRILNVASLGAFQPVPSLALYAATKAFVLSLTEALSEELKGTGVTVTALCPGVTRTDMAARALESSQTLRLMPDVLIADPRNIAREGYAACMAGRVVSVPGLPNRLVSSLVGLYPRWLVRTFGGLVGRRLI
jgi:short-subunit dehydrogenase